MYKKVCKFCGKFLKFENSRKDKKFCNWECYRLYSKGKNHPMYGRKHTKKSLKQMSESSKGGIGYWRDKKRPPRTEKEKNQISNSLKGKKKSKKHCENISKAKEGVKLSKEHCESMRKSRLGGKHTEEHCENMRKSMLGKNKGKPSPRKGKKLPKEHCKNISISLKGENNPNWIGGKSFELYGIDFNDKLKKQIRKRDKYVCKMCEIKESKESHSVHHIDYNKKNNSFSNLITLCRKCHAKTSLKYIRDLWIKYCNDILNNKEIKNRQLNLL